MRRELEQVEIPDEHGARQRTWSTIEAAFAERTPARRRSRRLTATIALAATLALIGAAFSPAGKAVIDRVRRAVGVEHASPALFSLPTPGRMLVRSDAGVWVVHQDGSRRLLGRYRTAGWSPFGRYIVAARANELAALEPTGTVRWTLARPDVRSPRWAGGHTDTRIAYIDRSGVRVIAGDGRADHLVTPKTGPLAWRPGTPFTLAVLRAGRLELHDAASGRVLAHVAAGSSVDVLALRWAPDGKRALVVHPHELDIVNLANGTRQSIPSRGRNFVDAAFSPDGRSIAVLRRAELSLLDTNRLHARARRLFAGAGPFSSITWSSDGQWAVISWPAADQWVFVRADGNRIRAVAGVRAQFHSTTFPHVEGWAIPG